MRWQDTLPPLLDSLKKSKYGKLHNSKCIYTCVYLYTYTCVYMKDNSV